MQFIIKKPIFAFFIELKKRLQLFQSVYWGRVRRFRFLRFGFAHGSSGSRFLRFIGYLFFTVQFHGSGSFQNLTAIVHDAKYIYIYIYIYIFNIFQYLIMNQISVTQPHSNIIWRWQILKSFPGVSAHFFLYCLSSPQGILGLSKKKHAINFHMLLDQMATTGAPFQTEKNVRRRLCPVVMFVGLLPIKL